MHDILVLGAGGWEVDREDEEKKTKSFKSK